MKNSRNFILTLAFIGASTFSYAQNFAIETVAILMQQDTMIHEDYVKAVEQIESAAQNEKTSNWAKMWYYRGSLYLKLYRSNDVETKKQVGDPLALAYESIMNVEKGEKADRYLEDAKWWMVQTGIELFNQASIEYNAGNYQKVISNYEKVVSIIPYDKDETLKHYNITPEYLYSQAYALLMYDASVARQVHVLINELGKDAENDSIYKAQIDFYYSRTLQYYDGFKGKEGSAMYNKTNVQSLKDLDVKLVKQSNSYIQKLMDMRYLDPAIYVNMSRNYLDLGDTAKALEVIAKAQDMPEFETNVDIIKQKLEIYLKQGRTQELIQESNKAIELDPNNQVLYFVRGVSYDQLGYIDSAIADYKMAIELDPNYYDAYYNLGAAYTNQTESIINKMNDPKAKMTQKQYDALALEVDSLYIKALPYFEQGLEVLASDNLEEKIRLATTMKGLYQRLQANFPGYMEKYMAIKKDIKAWEEALEQ